MSKKILILGGGGIVGQHLLQQNSYGHECYITRTQKSKDWWINFDSNNDSLIDLLNYIKPNFIINLSGENRVDIVEENPKLYYHINVILPAVIADWCKNKSTYYIQCSTQGVFSGNNAEYSPYDIPHPITHYGKQRLLAEQTALSINNSEVARLTFVLGIRPYKNIGRTNPLEVMLDKDYQLQVNDRYFSPLFATDAADILWDRVNNSDNSEKIYHLGNPIRCSRFTIASDLVYTLNGEIKPDIQPVSHEYFTGLAPRPFDTTWKLGESFYKSSFEDGLIKAYLQWRKLYNEQ